MTYAIACDARAPAGQRRFPRRIKGLAEGGRPVGVTVTEGGKEKGGQVTLTSSFKTLILPGLGADQSAEEELLLLRSLLLSSFLGSLLRCFLGCLLLGGHAITSLRLLKIFQ